MHRLLMNNTEFPLFLTTSSACPRVSLQLPCTSQVGGSSLPVRATFPETCHMCSLDILRNTGCVAVRPGLEVFPIRARAQA